jgi:hypothetical protein
MENLGKLVYVLFMFVITIVIQSFIFTLFWGWFIVPTFKLLPITLVQSMGIVFLIKTYFVTKNKTDNDTSWDNIFLVFGEFLGRSFFTIVFGYLISLFI